MSIEEKISDFLARADTRPAASKLESYRDLIRTLRQRRWTFREIAMALREEFGVSVAPSTIHAFVKVRKHRKEQPSFPSAAADNSPMADKPPAPKPRFHLDA